MKRPSSLVGKTVHHNVLAITDSFGQTWRKEEARVVRVMAVAEGYAMVRRKGCVPYIAGVKALTEIPK